MTDCTCHAGKICEIHVEEVMGNLNKLVCKACGMTKHPLQEHPMCSVPDPESSIQSEKIERDILNELSELRQKVLDMETAKAFHVSIYENIIQRLNDAEDKLRLMERIFGGLELQQLRGTG